MPNLETLIREVIESGQPRDQEVRDVKAAGTRCGFIPYRVAGRKVKGAVIVLVDIDPHKQAEQSSA